ncbi:hypothetical protein AYX14_02569 [Cryptococcus neoformans]|nr:hypothetical protein AYX14_02569 [Cryptococcus neoformans var. grubii]
MPNNNNNGFDHGSYLLHGLLNSMKSEFCTLSGYQPLWDPHLLQETPSNPIDQTKDSNGINIMEDGLFNMALNSFPPVTNNLPTQFTPVGTRLPIIQPSSATGLSGQSPLQLAAISDTSFFPPLSSNQVPPSPQQPRLFVPLPYNLQLPTTITQDFHTPAPSQPSEHQTPAAHRQGLNSHPLVHHTASSPARVSKQPAPYHIPSSAEAGPPNQLHITSEGISSLQDPRDDIFLSELPTSQAREPRRTRNRVSEEDRKRRLQACEGCRRARHKCQEGGSDKSLPCMRCKFKGITCVWSDKKRMFGRQGLSAQRRAFNQTSAHETNDSNQTLVNINVRATVSPMSSERNREPRRTVSDTVITASTSSQRPFANQTVPSLSPLSAQQLADQYLQLITGQAQTSQLSDAIGSQLSQTPLPWQLMAPQQSQNQYQATRQQGQQEQQQLALDFTEFASTEDGNNAATGRFQYDSLIEALYAW